jgi:hypothetical protein
MKRLVTTAALAALAIGFLLPPAPACAQESFSTWSLWVGGHYTGFEDYYKKVGEFDRGKEEAMPEVALKYSGYQGQENFYISGHFYDPQRLSLHLEGSSKDIVSAQVSYRSFRRQRGTDLMENLMVREATDRTASTPGGKMVTHEDTDPDADYGYTRHQIESNFQVKVPGSSGVRFWVTHRSLLEDGEEQKVVSMHCSSCHMVSTSASVDRRTHTINTGVEGELGPLLLSYELAYRNFRSEVVTSEAFYDTAQHPVNAGAMAEFGARVNFNGEFVPFGQYADIQKLAHTIKVKAEVGRGQLLTGFTNSTAENQSADLKVKGNHGSLRFAYPLSRRIKMVASASLGKIENDEVFVDLAPWREGLTGGGQSFDFTRYSNLTRTETEGSLELIYQRSSRYRLSLLGGYEATKRDDYPEFGAEEKTTKLKFQMGVRYRPSLKFTGRLKYLFESIDNPFSPFERMFEASGNPGLAPLANNTQVFYFQRDSLRYGQVTNQPSSRHGVEVSLSFKPTMKFGFSPGLKVSMEKNSDNDNLDFERSKFQPYLSLNLSPNASWNFFGSYSYLLDKSNGLAVVPMMDG